MSVPWIFRPTKRTQHLLKKKVAHLSACLFPEEPMALILRVSFSFVPQNSLFLRHRARCGLRFRHAVRQSHATIRGMLIEAGAMSRRLLRYAQNGAIFCLLDGRSGALWPDVSQILCPTT